MVRVSSKLSVSTLGDDPVRSLGQWILNSRQKFDEWVGSKPQKTPEEEKFDEVASVIRTYRGLAEEEDTDADKHWVDRSTFDVMMSIIIVLNTVLIGVEVDLGGDGSKGEREWYWYFTEAIFVVIFLGEVVAKIWAHKTWKWIFFDVWNIVTLGVAIFTFVNFVCALFGVYGNLRMLSLFRIVGLVRLTRIIRRYNALVELRLTIQGLVASFQTLVWTVILVAVFLYVCAVVLTKEIGHNRDVYGNYRKLSGGWDHEEYFGTVGRSMYTLLQCMTLDSWSSRVARHVIANQWWMAGFWVVFLVLSTFGILNIVVSVIVEHMLNAAKSNKKRMQVREERQRRMELESIRDIFKIADDDGSGDLSRAEFRQAVLNKEVQWRMRQLDLPLSDAERLFDAIDGDGDKDLSIGEFIKGCAKLKGPAQSKDLLAVQAQADMLAKNMDTLMDSLEASERMMNVLDELTNRINQRFGPSVVGSRRRIAHNVGGSKPMKPPKRNKPGDSEVPLSISNRPVLPQFPDLLR